MNLTFVIVLIAYVAIMIAIAAWFGRASAMKDGEDFVLAGKSLPTWVLAGTLLATFVGSGSIIGGANFIFSNGPLAGILFFGGTFCGIIVLYFIAPKVRRNGFRTVPELFESSSADRFALRAPLSSSWRLSASPRTNSPEPVISSLSLRR